MNWRTATAFLHDLVATAILWLAAYWMRFNFEVPQEFSVAAVQALVWVMPLYLVSYLVFGLYRGIWRYASMGDLKRLLMAVGLGGLALATAIHLAHWPGVPRSVLVLHPILLVLVMGGNRFLYRAWKDGHLFSTRFSDGKPVLVLGAGDAAAALISDLSRSSAWRVVGLLDDNATKHGRRMGEVPVLGGLDKLAAAARRLQVSHAIIAMPSASAATRRRAAELAAAAGLQVLTVPAIADVLSGKVSVSQVRRVELDDLLGRDPVQLDDEGLHRLLDRQGRHGDRGGRLDRLRALPPDRAFRAAEPGVLRAFRVRALFDFEQEFAGMRVECVVGDVKDAATLDAAFRRIARMSCFMPRPTSMCR